jgi:uncharacterized membrane protein
MSENQADNPPDPPADSQRENPARKVSIVKVLVTAVLVLYPVVIFCSLVIFKFPLRYLSVFVIIFASVYIFMNNRNYQGKNRWMMFLSPVLLFGIGITCLLVNSSLILKIYPALSDMAYLIIFGISFFAPPPIVYNFAVLVDKSFKTSMPKERLDKYCRDMTIVWCVFFVLDGIIALTTVFLASDLVWGIYNGGISYAAMGLIFVVEFTIYKVICRQERNMKKT